MRIAGIGMWVMLAVIILCSRSSSAQIRINELQHSPSNKEPEWVELYNAGPDSVDIQSWTINNKNRVRYTLTPSEFYIRPHSFLVLTKSDAIVNFHPDVGGNYIVVDWSQYFLVNAGDTVALHDENGHLIDSVLYAPSWGGGNGRSLERKIASDSSRSKSNWATSVDPSGSTPGRRNSVTPLEHDLAISSFSASFLAGQSKGIFDLSIKNRGYAAALSFSVAVFIDHNGDSLAQEGELAASNSGGMLSAGDSVRLRIEQQIVSPGRSNAIAVLSFTSDDDTTNNKMIAPVNLSYSAGSVVVNEIMYAPASPQPEWVELYNVSSDSIILDGFTLADNTGTKAKVPRSHFTLPPSGYVVVADDSTFFDYHPGLSGKAIVVNIPSLNNSGDAVVIHDASGNLMDSVAYSPSWGGNSGGRSLERMLPGGGSNDPQNFETSLDSARSTPGKINSVTPRDHDLAIGNITWSPVSLQSGGSATINAHILNVGLRPSGSSKAILFRDTNNDLKLSPGESQDSAEIAAIPPGDSVAVTFGSGILSFGSHRFGIILNSKDDERIENNSKNFILKVGLPPSTVVLNEVMYAPVQPEKEWLEMYNTSDAIIDLSNFRILSHGGSSKIVSGSLIGPHGFAVFCKDSSVAGMHYGVNPLFVQSIPSLSNGGDGIGLRDNLGNLLDTMNYEPTYGGNDGRSLERIDYLAANDSTNWAESVDTTGATPGMQNSVAILPFDAAVKHINVSAAPASPGKAGSILVVVVNRGRNEAANASVNLEVVRDLDSETIYSETRRIVQTLAPKDSASVQFSFSVERSGSYTALAKVLLDNDTRFRNDTSSAKFDVAFEPQSIIINEIMFTKGPMGEYFEVFNRSQTPIDLTHWTFNTSNSTLKPFHYSPKGPSDIGPLFLSRDRYFVVAADSSLLTTVADTSTVSIVKSLALRDDGDCIVISDPSGNIVDSVYYLPSWHNADIARTTGRSLEKINPSLPSNERSSWSTSVSRSGGTPGERNSLFVSPRQEAAGSISISPNPFSPDGDGHDDFTFISYSFPVTSVKIRVRIFDSVGRLIATPTDNIVLPSSGQVVWDGRDGSGRIVRFGLYILFMEVTGPDGNSLATYKKPVVVAKRMR